MKCENCIHSEVCMANQTNHGLAISCDYFRNKDFNKENEVKLINVQSTADVKEVVCGEWRDEIGDCHSTGKYRVCSNCGKNVFIPYFSKQGLEKIDFPFCPNCGADMRCK